MEVGLRGTFRGLFHLRIRTLEGSLLSDAIAITGNAKALLNLRAQIDRALKDQEDSYPFEEGVYHDVRGTPFEVAVKRARSPEEMQEPVHKPEKTAEKLPWAQRARRTKVEEEGGSG